MITVAFCDDDAAVLQKMEVYCDHYAAQRNQAIIHSTFHSPLDLLAKIEQGSRFDVLFLDILMPGEDGMKAAAEIRNYDRNVEIIFLSSSKEYALQSYDVNAFYYHLKPLREDAFFRTMDAVLAQYEKEQSRCLILRCKNGITRIEPDRVEYCEVIHRTLLIHRIDGTVLESVGNMEELSQRLLPFGCFLRPHRSYLVNLAHIQRLSYQSITTINQMTIPIPRGKYHQIKERYLEYAFKNRQVIV